MFSDLGRLAEEECELYYMMGMKAGKLEIQLPLLVKIEALLAITATIIVFVGIYGSVRRCSATAL